MSFTVTYNGNGNTGGTAPVDSNVYAMGDPVEVILDSGNLVKAGWGFYVWNTQSNGLGDNYFPADFIASITDNVILYAIWYPTVIYDGNGNTGGTAPVDPMNPYEPNYEVTVLDYTDLVKTGYFFAHWNTSANDNGTTYNAQETFNISDLVILYAIWQLKYTVTYDGNGSTGGAIPVDSNTYDPTETVSVLGNSGNLVKTDYSFKEWNTQADGLGQVYAETDQFQIEVITTLYAQWTPVYTVTFDSMGGSAVNPQIIDSGNQADIVLAYVEWAGHGIQGWSTDNTTWSTLWDFDNNLVTEDITLYALWDFGVTFDSQGGSPVEGQTVICGNGLSIPTDPTYDSYIFNGWYKDAECTHVWDFNTDLVPVDLLTNYTLYASWQQPVVIIDNIIITNTIEININTIDSTVRTCSADFIYRYTHMGKQDIFNVDDEINIKKIPIQYNPKSGEKTTNDPYAVW